MDCGRLIDSTQATFMVLDNGLQFGYSTCFTVITRHNLDDSFVLLCTGFSSWAYMSCATGWKLIGERWLLTVAPCQRVNPTM